MRWFKIRRLVVTASLIRSLSSKNTSRLYGDRTRAISRDPWFTDYEHEIFAACGEVTAYWRIAAVVPRCEHEVPGLEK